MDSDYGCSYCDSNEHSYLECPVWAALQKKLGQNCETHDNNHVNEKNQKNDIEEVK